MFKTFFLTIIICTSTVFANAGGVLDDVLLDYIDYNYRTKRIHVEQARAMNLTSDGSNAKVVMKIKSADDKTFGVFEANALAPKRNKSFLMQGFLRVGGGNPMIDLSGAGDYLLEFSANGKVFDTFPFSLTPYTSEKGESWFVMDGLWNDHALIDTSVEFRFSVWMRDMLEGTGKRTSDYGTFSARIVREKDGKVIGTTAGNTKDQRLAPMRKWTRYNITFVAGKGEAKIGLYDITAQDGAYSVELTHDGKIYGKYPFTVQGGKLRGVSEFRGTTLETVGGDYTWLKRTGGR